MCPRMSTPLPRLEEARRAEEGRTRGPDPSSLAIVSGLAHAVIRRVTVERRLLGGQDQIGYGQFQARKAEDESSKGSERTVSFEKWLDTDEEAMSRCIGSVSRHDKYSQRDWQAWEKIQGTGDSSMKILQEQRIWCQCSENRLHD